MTQQFLHRLKIHAGSPEVCCERVAETMPTDHLALDACSHKGRTNGLLSTMSGLNGFLPCSRSDGNKKSSSP